MVVRHRTTFRLIALVLLVAFVSSACATASQKYVGFPTQGQPPDKQRSDRMECEDIATQHRGSDADEAIAMGLLGTAVGSISGAAWGAVWGALASGASAGSGSLAGLAIGATAGLIVGIIQGANTNRLRYERIYVACLVSKGYTVGG